jgi:hypothetical protein
MPLFECRRTLAATSFLLFALFQECGFQRSKHISSLYLNLYIQVCEHGNWLAKLALDSPTDLKKTTKIKNGGKKSVRANWTITTQCSCAAGDASKNTSLIHSQQGTQKLQGFLGLQKFMVYKYEF